MIIHILCDTHDVSIVHVHFYPNKEGVEKASEESEGLSFWNYTLRTTVVPASGRLAVDITSWYDAIQIIFVIYPLHI